MREIDEQLGRCCGNFTIRVTQDGFLELETTDGHVVPQEELSDFVLARYRPVSCTVSKPFASLERASPMR
jgi:hypothetical protein